MTSNVQPKWEEKPVERYGQDDVITISFISEQDRVKGIGALFKSHYSHISLGRNEYSVGKDVINSKMFENKNIKYKILNTH